MLALTPVGAVFLVVVVGVAVGLIAWLLSGPGVQVRSAPVRASATPGSGGGASGSDRPGPTPVATPEPPGR